MMLSFPSFRFSRLARLGLLAATLAASSAAMAQTAICYNCPTEWADWGTQLKAIKAKTGITVPADNKNSGQSLAQLVAEKASPVADVTYLGVTFAVQAQKDGVVEPYKPAAWKDIPDGLKDPQATGSPFTRARSVSWSTSMRSRASRFPSRGPTC